MTKRFFLDQHGCAKNQVDGELLIGILTDKGWQKTVEPENADLIIVNSCGFIEPAKRESIEAVITARTAYPQAKILLAGCLAERYGDIFKTDFEEADAFFGNGDLSQLPILIDRLFPDAPVAQQQQSPNEHDQSVHSTEHSRPFLKPAQEGVCCGSRPELLNFPRSAFIKITEGCDNCCSFCAIPLIRGSVRSRPLDSIINEIQGFVQQGYKEFNLIGQDLAVYETTTPLDKLSSRLNNNLPTLPAQKRQGLSGLAQLLHAISGIEGTFSVRLLYIHPDHFPPDILPIMTADTRFLPYFDIPFQSGSDPIIRAMNRCGSAETYLKLIENIRAAFRTAESPYGEAVIRTTFLTGFPGETQADFERTAAFLQAAQSLWSGAFAYSQEEGTKAADMKKQVPAKIAEQRKTALNELQLKITEQKLAAFCGLEMDVLIEEIIPQEHNNEEENTQCCIALGRAWFQAPEVDGAVVVNFSQAQKDSEGLPITAGSLVRVRITALRGIDLEADAL
ncbi:MiaB/RimO family radical SAM methylthiotransferase [Treponema medium]|uniref:Ribosomal protein uS12 methylthiotransferase RimO n=2 Tax=Treponema medium TaxID=58231 RepID=A0AA87TE30_TREMD|nr:MiaB/RimO family radical SAM methylthiotransferase [Treponema medium]EPF27764.1 ribosomal protein S12 methylthiotransferase RimO [Treponema medium ATCC 700293]QSH98359.1 MiaB/RimO family radical SAM methylthiotransferase [Treponema medium]